MIKAQPLFANQRLVLGVGSYLHLLGASKKLFFYWLMLL